MILCSLAGDTNISEECTASIFTVEEYGQQETVACRHSSTLKMGAYVLLNIRELLPE
jgi:hypothetical protein